jgi:hypothetical protein
MYPDPSYYDNREAYDEAMYNAFGDHYLPLNWGYLDEPGFYQAGHEQIAQALYQKLDALGYLTELSGRSPASESSEEAAEEDAAAEDDSAAEEEAAVEEDTAEESGDAG